MGCGPEWPIIVPAFIIEQSFVREILRYFEAYGDAWRADGQEAVLGQYRFLRRSCGLLQEQTAIKRCAAHIGWGFQRIDR